MPAKNLGKKKSWPSTGKEKRPRSRRDLGEKPGGESGDFSLSAGKKGDCKKNEG